MGIMHRTLKMDRPLSTSTENPDASPAEAQDPLSDPRDPWIELLNRGEIGPHEAGVEYHWGDALDLVPPRVERRGAFRLLLDSLGLRVTGRHHARHPEGGRE